MILRRLEEMTDDPLPGARQHGAGRPTPRLSVSHEREVGLRARLAARDERALADLIEVATPWLLGVVQGMLQDADESEDVLLETFRLAWERVTPVSESSGAPQGLMPWLLRIARNKAIDRLRARKHRASFGLRFLAADPYQAEDRAQAEPEVLARPGWQVHRAVRGALDSLPEEQRHVVELSYFQGMTQSAIATHLSLPLGTVKTRLRLALGRLRVALTPIRDWLT